MPNPSRGDAISGYHPAFAKGAKIYTGNIKAAFLSGTVSGLTSGVVAIAHGLAAVPKFISVVTLAAHANIVAATANEAFLAAASAANATSFYIKTKKGGNVKYGAFVIL